MPLLTGAITALGVACLPAQPYGDFTKNPSPASERTYTEAFTRLSNGTPGRVYGSFAGRAETAEDSKFVSDVILARVTEGPFNEIEVELVEWLHPKVTDARSASLARSVSDTIRPRVSDEIQFLQKSGAVPKAVSDSVRVFVAEGRSYRVPIPVTESILPVVTEGSSVQKDDALEVADTITLVLGEVVRVDTAIGTRNFFASDSIRPRVSERAIAGVVSDVDSIRIVLQPYGFIRITEV
jgi:hypothetical protein